MSVQKTYIRGLDGDDVDIVEFVDKYRYVRKGIRIPFTRWQFVHPWSKWIRVPR